MNTKQRFLNWYHRQLRCQAVHDGFDGDDKLHLRCEKPLNHEGDHRKEGFITWTAS